MNGASTTEGTDDADKHTIDGNARRVSVTLMPAAIGMNGLFALGAAMAAVDPR